MQPVLRRARPRRRAVQIRQKERKKERKKEKKRTKITKKESQHSFSRQLRGFALRGRVRASRCAQAGAVAAAQGYSAAQWGA
eukprot:986112-Rhodomonas_salina.2